MTLKKKEDGEEEKNDYNRYRSRKIKNAITVKSELRNILGDFLRNHDFIEISPVIISSETDPLQHSTEKAGFEYYDGKYILTQSMILHKQIAMLSFNKIFTFSPNVRLEPRGLIDSGRHLVEFSQLDLEISKISREELIKFGEKLLIHTLSKAKERCQKELDYFERKLNIPDPHFDKITYQSAYKKYGKGFDETLSQQKEEPFWLVDFPSDDREFYDREDPSRPGILKDMDLIYPEGYGEALSGGEREFKPDRIKKRLKEQDLNLKDFQEYLKFAEKGLSPSGGFGLGLERLTRFVCGLDDIKDTVLFPKRPGKISL